MISFGEFFNVIATGAKIGGGVVKAGYTVCKNEQIKQQQAKIKETEKWLRKAEDTGDYELFMKAYECYQDDDFNNSIYFSKKSIEQGEEKRRQMFGG